MVDVLMILERLKRLAEYIEFLEKHKQVTYKEFSENQMMEWAVERVLQLAIQVIIDIATHILATTSNVTPQDYTDALVKLARVGVVPAEFAERIKGMSKFRNVLVHEYVNIDTRKVYQNWQDGLNDFILFAHYINDWLAKNNLLEPKA